MNNLSKIIVIFLIGLVKYCKKRNIYEDILKEIILMSWRKWLIIRILIPLLN